MGRSRDRSNSESPTLKKKRKSRSKSKSKRKRRHSSSSTSSCSSTSSSSDSSSSSPRRRKSSKEHKRHKRKKRKKHRKRSSSSSSSSSRERKKSKKRKKKKKKMKKSVAESEIKEMLTVIAPKQNSNKDKEIKKNSGPRVMKPMTKEEWERQQSIVRRVYDPETGRNRLVKGDGEIVEEIVSKDRHKEINKQSTAGDGLFFQTKMGLNR